MKQSHLRDDTGALHSASYSKSPITVERSSVVSTKHEINESSQQLCHAELPQHRSKTQPDIPPRTTYKAKAPACRPSTVRNSSNADGSVYLGPPISPSREELDLHEALRCQLPPFRQSKRWAKTYMNEKDSTEPLLSTETLGTKDRHALTCDTSSRVDALTIPDAVSISDEDSKYYGFCRPMKIPGWQLWHHHRLFKRSLNPVKVAKISGSRSVRRKRSLECLEAQTQVSRRRAVMPKAVQSKCRNMKEQGRTQVRSMCVKDPRMSPGSVVSDLTDGHNEQSGSPVSPIHDYEKVKRFSEECVNMLSGLDFGEEWRLSIIGPRLSLPRKPSFEVPVPKTQSTRDLNSPILDVRTATQRLDTAFQALKQTSSQLSPAEAAKQAQSADFTCRSIYSNRNNTKSIVGGAICDRGNSSSLSSFRIANDNSSQSTFNHFAANEYTRDLENTRSVDTLTRIEAQVEVPDAATHRLQKKDSCFTLSPSPKRQRPSGGPPKGPLPCLPKEDTSKNRSVIEKCPSFTSSHKSKAILHTLDLADPFKLSSVKTVVTTPNHSPSPVSRRLRNVCNTSNSSGIVNYELAVADSSSVRSAESWHKPNKILPCAASTSREAAIRRSSKIRETKGKDVDKWDSSQEDVNTFLYEASMGRSTTSIETQRKCPPVQLPVSKPGTLLSNVVLHSTNSAPQQHTLQNSSTLTLPAHRIMSTNNLPIVVGSKVLDNRRRVASKTGPSRRNQANRGKKLHPAVSSPNLYQQFKSPEQSKQALEHSQIMIVVDTEPRNSGFRTGVSPYSNVVHSMNRPVTPTCDEAGRQVPQTPLSKPTGYEHPTSAELDHLAELIDIVKPPSSMQKKRSLRGLKSQGISSRIGTSTPIACTPERRTSSTKAGFRHQSTLCTPTFDSSDSDLEDSPLLRENHNSSALKSRSKSRIGQVKSHMRRDTPLTSMLKSEVQKAEEQIENLKRYEKRIEHLQLHLDQTMKVWDRMTQKGKRRYLESVFNVTDQNLTVDSTVQAQATDNDTASIVARSTSSKDSGVQETSTLSLRSSSKALKSNQTSEEMRCISSISTVTSTHDNTDTNTGSSTASRDSSQARRVSGGSLTDPQDYNFPPLPPSRRPTSNVGVNDSRPARRTKAESLGANLDDFRTRLQASRPPVIPARRCRLQSSPVTTNTKETATRPGTAVTTATRSSSNRFAVAPWEEQDEVLQRIVNGGVNEENLWDANDDQDYGSFEPDDEVIRTDQMDAMLVL